MGIVDETIFVSRGIIINIRDEDMRAILFLGAEMIPLLKHSKQPRHHQHDIRWARVLTTAPVLHGAQWNAESA